MCFPSGGGSSPGEHRCALCLAQVCFHAAVSCCFGWGKKRFAATGLWRKMTTFAVVDAALRTAGLGLADGGVRLCLRGNCLCCGQRRAAGRHAGKLHLERMMEAEDTNFMKQALAEAREAGRKGEVPVGAVVVCKGRIVARAHNLTETLTDVTAHAEMQAITAAASALGGKYLTDCTLYVTVEPCVMCAGAIAWAQVARLVFGAADEKRGYRRYAPQALHPKTQVEGGVLADDCAELMKTFFAVRRR